MGAPERRPSRQRLRAPRFERSSAAPTPPAARLGSVLHGSSCSRAGSLLVSMATTVCDVLWGSTPMVAWMVASGFVGGEPRSLLLRNWFATPLSSHTAARLRPSRSSFVGQTCGRVGRHFVSYLDQDLSNATERPQRTAEVSRRHFRGSVRGVQSRWSQPPQAQVATGELTTATIASVPRTLSDASASQAASASRTTTDSVESSLVGGCRTRVGLSTVRRQRSSCSPAAKDGRRNGWSCGARAGSGSCETGLTSIEIRPGTIVTTLVDKAAHE